MALRPACRPTAARRRTPTRSHGRPPRTRQVAGTTTADPTRGRGQPGPRCDPGTHQHQPRRVERDQTRRSSRALDIRPAESCRGGRVPIPAAMITTRSAANTSTCTPSRRPRPSAARTDDRTRGRGLKAHAPPDRTSLGQERRRRSRGRGPMLGRSAGGRKNQCRRRGWTGPPEPDRGASHRPAPRPAAYAKLPETPPCSASRASAGRLRRRS